MNEIYLKEIKHEACPKERVCDWKYEEVDESVRLYFKVEGKAKSGFYFYAIENGGCISNDATKKDHWNENYCFAECIINGIAYFDGVRHLYYGDEKTQNYGYHYYPDLSTIIDVLNKLKELEDKYCDA